jgi:hypothetical protein
LLVAALSATSGPAVADAQNVQPKDQGHHGHPHCDPDDKAMPALAGPSNGKHDREECCSDDDKKVNADKRWGSSHHEDCDRGPRGPMVSRRVV